MSSLQLEETLRELGHNFNIDDKVVDALIKAKKGNLEEFRYFFEAEDKVQGWLSKLSLGEDAMLQGSRLRRAWAAVVLWFKQGEQDRARIAQSDLDAILADTELRNLKATFWRRYKQRYPADVHPSDATISRVSRELSKRMLCVYNLWKVRSLQVQLSSTQQKHKLTDRLYLEEVDETEPTRKDVETYLDRLWTLLLAYSMAGSEARTGATVGTEVLGADSTEYVEVPLDLAQQYYYRGETSRL